MDRPYLCTNSAHAATHRSGEMAEKVLNSRRLIRVGPLYAAPGGMEKV